MTMIELALRQYRWRRWSDVYPYLGDLSGAQAAGLGCGIGDQAHDLSRLGAHVFGMDGNQGAIDHAKSRAIPHARFVCGDITDIKGGELKSDGVWTSFTAAYFPRIDIFLERFGDEAMGLDSAFLDCLASKEHRSRSSVWFVFSRKPV